MEFNDLVNKARTVFGTADAKKIEGKFAFQFDVTGEGGGTFYVEIKDGKLSVEPYDYIDRDAKFIIDSDNMLKMLEGNLDPVKAFTAGKLKIEGELGKALELNKLLTAKPVAKPAAKPTVKAAKPAVRATKTPAKSTKTPVKTTAKASKPKG